MFGVDILGVMALICSTGGKRDVDKPSGIPSTPFGVSVGVSVETIGRTACHSPNLRATPFHTGSVARSAGVQTRPRMNLYSRPL